MTGDELYEPHYTDLAQGVIRRVPTQITNNQSEPLLVPLPHGQWTGEAPG